ncbi:MAG: hypothetical protein OEM38_04105 [Gammaproteobacteria bacterium]|nr:hypothetical protein [Gammaproteobacteria bacterium]
MDMNINASDFLTAEQKKEIGAALTTKILDGIEQMQFSKAKKLDLVSSFNQIIENAFENGDLYDQMDFAAVGKKLSKKVLDAI